MLAAKHERSTKDNGLEAAGTDKIGKALAILSSQREKEISNDRKRKKVTPFISSDRLEVKMYKEHMTLKRENEARRLAL